VSLNSVTKSKLDMVHITDFYWPAIGGLEKAVQELAEAQAKEGHNVVVIASREFSKFSPRSENLNDVRVLRINSISLFKKEILLPIQNFKSACYEEIDNADIVHIHTQNSIFCLILGKLAKKYGKPIIWQFLAVDYTKRHPNKFIRLLGPYYQALVQREALKLSDLVVTVTIRDQSELKNKCGVHSVVVPHGISKYYMEVPRNQYSFRKTFEIWNKKIILYIGRVHPLKGLHILIESLQFLKRNLTDFVTVIIGTGDKGYISRLVRLSRKFDVEKHVRFLGYVDEVTKISALDASSVLVLPSIADYETYSLVVDEAWSRKLPIVVSAVGALPFRVKDMENGLLIEPRSSQSLAWALERILTDENLAGILGENGSRNVITWDQVARRYLMIYQRLLLRH